jgi:CubicO group peptidase (beta-lactamase class C family)
MKNNILFLFTCLSTLVFGQNQGLKGDSLDRFIKSNMQAWNVPGMAVLVVKDGKVLHMKGYGVKDYTKTEPVNEHTLFMIASNSKAFTGTLLANLEFEKKISLNDRVSQYIPSFTLFDKNAANLTSIKDLLVHRIGLKTFQGDFMYWDSELSRAEVINKMALLKPNYDFRDGYGYCNACYLTAGEIIPKVSGNIWEQELKTKILDPLKMNRTVALSVDLPEKQNIAVPHTWWYSSLKTLPYPKIDNIAPAGSMSSSIHDLSHWLLMQLDSGRFEGKQILPWQVIEKTREGVNLLTTKKVASGARDYLAYGLGWFVQERYGKKLLHHSGGADGFLSQTALIPELNLGVVVLTNSDCNNLYSDLAFNIIDSYLGHFDDKASINNARRFWVEKKKTDSDIEKLQKETLENKIPAFDLAAYAGTYEHPVYGKMRISTEGKALKAVFEHHRTHAIFQALGDHNFLCSFSNILYGVHKVNFSVENNKVKSISIKVNDFVEYDPYEFLKIK